MFSLYVCVCEPRACLMDMEAGPKRVLDPLDLETKAAASHNEDAVN